MTRRQESSPESREQAARRPPGPAGRRCRPRTKPSTRSGVPQKRTSAKPYTSDDDRRHSDGHRGRTNARRHARRVRGRAANTRTGSNRTQPRHRRDHPLRITRTRNGAPSKRLGRRNRELESAKTATRAERRHGVDQGSTKRERLADRIGRSDRATPRTAAGTERGSEHRDAGKRASRDQGRNRRRNTDHGGQGIHRMHAPR